MFCVGNGTKCNKAVQIFKKKLLVKSAIKVNEYKRLKWGCEDVYDDKRTGRT